MVGSQCPAVDADLEGVLELVQHLSGRGHEPTVDDLLSVIDVAIAEDLALGRNWSVLRLAEVRLSLTRLIYKCIDAAVHLEEYLEGPLDRILNVCLEPACGGVVTLNWDCLVERTFSHLKRQLNGTIDYGIDTVDHLGHPTNVWSGALRILKPHGSLSWGHCPLCGLVVADLIRPFQFAGDRHCPHCHHPMLSPVLVPPVLSGKRPAFLDVIWKQMEFLVRNCERVVFIGYSFPVQDVDVRVRLIRALSQRALQRREPLRVDVVTRADPERPELAKLEERRYRAVLSGQVPDSCFTFTAHQDGLAGWIAESGI